jgi:hypothetical protein
VSVVRAFVPSLGLTDAEQLLQDMLFREYIELAAAIPTFGINLYNVIDGEFEKGGVKRRLGIGEDGIMLTRRAEKVNAGRMRALASLPMAHSSHRNPCLSLTPHHTPRRLCTTFTRGPAWVAGSRRATPCSK